MATQTTDISSKFKDIISNSVQIRPGPPDLGPPSFYQLKTEKEMFGTLTRMIVGEKDVKKPNKTILLVGETGAGKSTLIDALVNYTLGVEWEDEVWFQIVEEAKGRSQSESQTSDVIVYQIFGLEGKTLPYSLTIIDTPGYGSTKGTQRDFIVRERLFDLVRSKNGVHEVHAVGLVLKATENRLSERLMYILDSVMSLFGKDLQKNIVALITHSDGRRPKNALQALEAAKIKSSRNEKNQPVHFLFDNCQHEERTEDTEIYLQNAWRVTSRGMGQFKTFLEKSSPQQQAVASEVQKECIRLTACIQNLQERIRFNELKQRDIRQAREDLEVYKDVKPIRAEVCKLGFEAAVCCKKCKENCHYPGCTMALNPQHCEVMKDGFCTSCSGKCPASDHVKENHKYVIRTRKAQRTEHPQILNEVTAEKSQPQNELRAEKSQPQNKVTAEKSQPHNEVTAEQSQPQNKVTAEKSQPHNEVTAEQSQPQNKLTAEQSQPQNKVRAEQSQPQNKVTAEKSQPQNKVRAEQSQPQNKVTAEKSQPQNKVTAEQSQPQNKVTAEQSQPQNKVTAEKSQPHNEVTAEQSQPQNKVRAEQSQPQNKVTAEKSQPHNEVTAEKSQPHNEVRAEQSQPQNKVTAEKSQPHNEVTAEKSQPHNEVTAEKSQPHNEVTAEKSQPHNEVTAEKSQPHNEVTAEKSQPHNEVTAEESQLLNEAYQHVVRLKQVALNVDSVSTSVLLDFLIEKMKEKGDKEKLQELEELDKQMDDETRAALKHKMRSISSNYEDLTSESIQIRPGPPSVHQLRTKKEMFGTLTRITVGEKDVKKPNKTVLLVGETGAGKSTLIDALVNYTLGVEWEDEVWFQTVEEEKRSQSESQTSDVIVYQIFGLEEKTLPYSLTIIDTPGYGSTRGPEEDAVVGQRLFDLFRSEDGVHEVHAVGLVLKATENRLSDRLMYIFDSVMSLFGKDVEENIVALITHSDGRTPGNALQALEAAKIKSSRNEKNQPVHFLFDNNQKTQRGTTEKEKAASKDSWYSTNEQIGHLSNFLQRSQSQTLKTTVDVLNERVRLTACLQNLKDRIKLTELKQKEIRQIQEGLKEHQEEMKKNEKFTFEVDEVYKDKEPIDDGMQLGFYGGAVTCNVCEENCHYPGCTMAWKPERCEVMKRGRCTVCTGKCPASDHVKEQKKYVTKTRKVQKTFNDMKQKYEGNKAERENKRTLLENLEKEKNQLTAERRQLLDKAFQHVVKLEQIALNVDSLSVYIHYDFLIEKMKEGGDTEKVQKLEEMKRRVEKVASSSESDIETTKAFLKRAGKHILKLIKPKK
ncbi:uncharacterized protein PAE49_024549 isoform 1-T7 [Odontesthes bonariensis]|uniref:uncharacterized protein LOC142373323 n=1 Tax=Odontesthes bonariensis TaxID=219752 RepID=UPI003F588F4F